MRHAHIIHVQDDDHVLRLPTQPLGKSFFRPGGLRKEEREQDGEQMQIGS